MSSLAILRFANDDAKRVARETNHTFEEYCEKHGFTFIYEEDVKTYNRNTSWGKIPFIRDRLDKFNFILWVDADTILLNQEFNALEELEKSDKDFYVARDCNGINCGVFALRNSKYSQELLDKVWSKEDLCHHIWSEQAAFMELEDNFLLNHVEYLDQKTWNAYRYELYGIEREEGQLDENSFILHLPGLDNNKRLEVIREIKNARNK